MRSSPRMRVGAWQVVRHRLSCLIAVVGLVGAVSVVSLVATPASAGAVTCSGNSCNGKDPYATGCASGAYEITSAGRYLLDPYGHTDGSIIHLFWSPRCQTNWPVVTQPQSCSDSEGTRVEANVQNRTTGQWVNYTVQALTASTYVWGNMVYSPGPAWAYGDIDCNAAFDHQGYSGIA
jgi:hypothetical protein